MNGGRVLEQDADAAEGLPIASPPVEEDEMPVRRNPENLRDERGSAVLKAFDEARTVWQGWPGSVSSASRYRQVVEPVIGSGRL